MNVESTLTKKQEEFVKVFRSGKHRYLMIAGTTGSGKSIVTIGLIHLLCSNINGLRFAIVRKSEKNLRQTTIPTYNKTKRFTKSVNDSYIVGMTARYPKTGSEIVFVWADMTKDPELNNVRGLELTGALIEEANQIEEKYFNLLMTRIGRWNSHKCKPFIMLNLNPSGGWCKERFYDLHCENRLPESYYFIQFDKTDVQELIDSPNAQEMTEQFMQTIMELPDEERDRFVYNNWEYGTIPNQLVKYEWYKNAILHDDSVIIRNGEGFIAGDPTEGGQDDAGIGQMWGNHIGWWEDFKGQSSDDMGKILFHRATDLNIKKQNTIVDGVGIGSGTLVELKHLKHFPTVFCGGESPVKDDGFLKVLNMRAEAHWLFREGLRKEELTLTHHPKLQTACLKCTYSITDKVIKIPPKEVLKTSKYIGFSPAHLDVATMLAHHFYTSGGDLSLNLKNRQIGTMAGLNKQSVIGSGRTQRRFDINKEALIDN